MIEKLFADSLRQLRKERGLTQEALSERLGTSPVSIQNYENARRWPDPDILDRICAIFEVRPARLFSTPNEVAQPTPQEALDIIREALTSQDARFRELESKSAQPAIPPALAPLMGRIASLNENELGGLEEFLRGIELHRAAKIAQRQKKSTGTTG